MSTAESNINIDEYEHYNYEEVNSNRSGKHRSKTEAALHSNKHDPCGHTRKIAEKLANTEKNKRELKK